MRRVSARLLVVVVLAAAGLVATPLTALGFFATNITGPGPYAGAGITVFDNGPGDLNPAPNQITVIAGVGTPAIPGFFLSVDTSLTNSPGGPPLDLVDLNFTLSSLFSTGGTVTVTTSSQGFLFPPTGSESTLTSSIGGTITGSASVTVQQWANLANTLFGTGPITPGPQGPFTSPSFSNTASTTFISLTPFSITDQATLHLAGNSTTTGDLASQVVPVPGTLLLLGAGLLGLGAFGWRRPRREPIPGAARASSRSRMNSSQSSLPVM